MTQYRQDQENVTLTHFNSIVANRIEDLWNEDKQKIETVKNRYFHNINKKF